MLLGFSFNLTKVHEHGKKWCLTIGCHQGNHLILNGLDSSLNFKSQPLFCNAVKLLFCQCPIGHLSFFQYLRPDALPASVHKGNQMSKTDTLTSVLVTGYLRNNLRRHIAGS